MSIIPVSSLSSDDLKLLGNNVRSESTIKDRRSHPQLAAINRSLAAHGEQVERLHRQPVLVAGR